MLAILIILIILFIILLFSSPRFSPIPYFPSNKKDLPLIIKTLDLKNNQTIVDLGAGDGVVIFAAASEAYKQKLNTKFVAVDINPVLILIMYIIKAFHPNRKNIKIERANMFTYRARSDRIGNVTVYLYISPWYLEQVISNWKLVIGNFSVVSYMYPVKSLKKKEKKITGLRHDIFRYNVVQC